MEGVAEVGKTLTAIDLKPEGADVKYQWQFSANGETEWQDISDAKSETYVIDNNYVGKYIRLEVKGTGNYTGTKTSSVVGPVEEVEEPVETIEAEVDYNAVWNGDRSTWYIKVTVPDESLDENSIKSIVAVKEAGQEVVDAEPLIPDSDKVMWFGVAKGDGEVTLKQDGEYAYKVVRNDDSEYIFSFTYAANEVQGVEKVTTPGKLEGATDYAGYNEWSAAITDDGIDFSKITKDQAIAMGLPDVDYYGIAMKLVVGEETIDLNTTNLTKVERVTPSGDVQSALVTETGTVQFVHDGWGEAGKYTMYYYLTDGRIVEVTVNVVSFEFKGEAPVDTEAPKIDEMSLELEDGRKRQIVHTWCPCPPS